MPLYLPHGTKFKFNGQYVGGLVSVSVPDRVRGQAETTHSGSNFDRSFISGLRDGGTVELSFRQDPDDLGQLELEANYEVGGGGVAVAATIALPDVATSGLNSRLYTFNCFVTKPPQGALGLIEDAVGEQTATVKLAGPVTITTGPA